MKKQYELIKPGYFSLDIAADKRRNEFDYKNEQIIANNISVDYLFIGDSITQMWELSVYFKEKDRNIINRGICGDTTTYLLKRFEADAIQLKPQYIILLIGVNDTWKLESDPWIQKKGENMESILKQAMDNFSDIVNIAHLHNQKLVLCSVLPTNMTWLDTTSERNLIISQINNHLKMISNGESLIYVDYHTSFLDKDTGTLNEELSKDGLHPNVKGYRIMAEVLNKRLP